MTQISRLAEAISLSAIDFSMNQSCQANLIIAGPICSGKLPIADCLRMYFSGVKHYKITLMNQASFYKSLDEMELYEQGYKVDAMEAFHTDEFVSKVKMLFEKGVSSSPYYNMNTWTRGMPEMERQCATEEQRKALRTKSELFLFHNPSAVNVFVGTHTIQLLKDVVPNCMTIYLNTDFHICMERRLSLECYRKVANIKTIKSKNAYYDFVQEEVEWSIAPQKEAADIVLKANDED